jgi:hypothetical protein
MYVILNKTKKSKKISLYHIAGDGMIYPNRESIDNSYYIEFSSDTFVKQNEIDDLSNVLNADLFQVQTDKTVDRSYYYDSIQKDFFKIEDAEKPPELIELEKKWAEENTSS